MIRATEADAKHALDLLSLVPHPPNETEESIKEQIAGGWTFPAGDSLVRIAPQPERKHVEIIWWLPPASWLGEGMDALIASLAEVVTVYGKEAEEWMAGGIFDAPGPMESDMQRNSKSIAEIHLQWCPTAKVTRAEGTNFYRIDDVLGVALENARKWHGISL